MSGDILTVLIAMLGGAIRVSTPFMFVALGECLTEKSGRVNLGLEGTLVLGAMCAYATSYHTGSPVLGVLAAGCSGAVLGGIHGYVCKLPKVNDIAIGIAMMLFGTGLAFFFGKAREIREGTAIAVSHNITDRVIRVVAIGQYGQELRPTHTGQGGAGHLMGLDIEFNVPPGRIASLGM